MKHLFKLLVATVLFVGMGVANAQDENHPWAVELGVNAVDFYPVGTSADKGRIDPALRGDYFDEYFNANDHWNILPSVSRLAISRYIGSGFVFTAAGSINRIDKIGDAPADDLSYYSADGEVKYSFKKAFGNSWFDPSIGIGGGYTWVDDIGFGTANALVGVKFWVNENIALNFQSTYKHAFEDDYGITHFQHSVGMVFQFGGVDTDGDGIYDKDDECPETPGLAEFNGCPDTDGDGIPDHLDECPDTPGLAEFNGCPDTDGDGIADHLDECPTVAGLAKFKGCPDTDGDGIADHLDKCPNEAGPAANGGCPWPDRDGDGVLDKDDQCPDVAGTVANNGCPELSVEVLKALSDYAKTILFDTGKTTLKPASLNVLDNVVDILKEYPNSKFHIDGHTDSVGSDSNNQKLSEGRAAAVVNYLIERGIASNRLVSRGFGESKPIAPNTTKEGRTTNRRTEINLIPRN